MFETPPQEFRDYFDYLQLVTAGDNQFDLGRWKDLEANFFRIFHAYFLAFSGKDRSYTDAHIGGQIFENLYYEKDIKPVLFIYFVAIEKSLRRSQERIIEYSSAGNTTARRDELFMQKELIFEVSMFLGENSNVIFKEHRGFGFGKRTFASSNEVFNTSKVFSMCGRLPLERPFILGSTSVFLIRQSIELRIKNALGILYIFDENGFSKISGESFVDILIDDPTIHFPMEKSLLLKIHRWTNYFIHGGFIPEVWKIDWAHHLLSPLFSPGTSGNSSSIHGSIKIPKATYDNIEEKIKDHIVRGNPSVKKDAIQIIRTGHPEALIT